MDNVFFIVKLRTSKCKSEGIRTGLPAPDGQVPQLRDHFLELRIYLWICFVRCKSGLFELELAENSVSFVSVNVFIVRPFSITATKMNSGY